MVLCSYAYGDDGMGWLLGMWVSCHWKHCWRNSHWYFLRNGWAEMVFGNAVHTQILVGIIYFAFVYPLHSSSTGHMIAIISTLLQLQKMIDE